MIGEFTVQGDFFLALLALAEEAAGALESAQQRAEAAIARVATSGAKMLLGWAISAAARVALAQGHDEQAEDLVHEALAFGHETGNVFHIPDALELLALLAFRQASVAEAARLYGAAGAFRERTGYARFAIYSEEYESCLGELRKAMGEDAFERARAQGFALSLDEAVAYARRGRGERKRPSAGWASLTPAELEVVRLVGEGLSNKEIAARLFISPRTVQAHLTHVYTKLDVTSRVQLATEAKRRT
jgi:DNA-binding CsgD family transcriptional regulator